MIDINQAVQRLAFHEGCVLEPYRDHLGFWTIGVGRCFEKNPFTNEELKVVGDYKHGITKNAAYMLLRNDINRLLPQLEQKIPFWNQLNSDRQYAMLDMAFQNGLNGLLKFKKMIAAMGVGNWKEAKAQCLDSNYARQTPKRANRIANCIEKGVFEI